MSDIVKLEIEISQDDYKLVSDVAYILNVSPSTIISRLVTNSIIKAKAEGKENDTWT